MDNVAFVETIIVVGVLIPVLGLLLREHFGLPRKVAGLEQSLRNSYVRKVGTKIDPGHQEIVNRVQALEGDRVKREEFIRLEASVVALKEQATRDHGQLTNAIASLDAKMGQLNEKMERGLEKAGDDARVHTEILATLREIRDKPSRWRFRRQ